MSTQLPDIANGNGAAGQPEIGANMMPSTSGLAGAANEMPRQRSAFDSQRGSNPLADAKSVFQSRRERQEVERDAQLLANRIALLKQEEMKTWKKIEETKKKAAEVMRLKQKNEERIRSKVEKMQYDNMRAQETKDRINRMKEEHRFEKERIQKMTVLTKKEEARQARIRAEQDKIRFQTQQAYIQKLNQDRKSRVQEDQRMAKRKMEEQKIQKIRQQRLQVERQIRDEEEQITHKEQEVMQMELLELELIKKLQNTQAIQTQAYEELKQAIEQKGSGGFGYRSAGQSQFQGGLPMDGDQQQMEPSGEAVNNPPEVDPQPAQEVNQ